MACEQPVFTKLFFWQITYTCSRSVHVSYYWNEICSYVCTFLVDHSQIFSLPLNLFCYCGFIFICPTAGPRAVLTKSTLLMISRWARISASNTWCFCRSFILVCRLLRSALLSSAIFCIRSDTHSSAWRTETEVDGRLNSVINRELNWKSDPSEFFHLSVIINHTLFFNTVKTLKIFGDPATKHCPVFWLVSKLPLRHLGWKCTDAWKAPALPHVWQKAL